MFLVWFYFHKTHVSVSLSYPCSCPNPPSVSPSLLPPLCWQAARSYGRRRGNVWHFLWGFCLPCRPCLSEAEGGLSVVSLSAFHLCCDLNEIILISTHYFPTFVHLIRTGQGSTKSVNMNFVLLDGEREKKSVRQFNFLSILSQCSTCNVYNMHTNANYGCCCVA